MGFFDNITKRNKTEPTSQSIALSEWLTDCNYDGYSLAGYTTMANTPEVKAVVEKIADIVSTMTIYQMQNYDNGDVRLNDGLARFIDIEPNENMNRQLLISWIVQEMILTGNAVVTIKTERGYLSDLNPLPHTKYSFVTTNKGYGIRLFENQKILEHNEFLHFRYNPSMKNPYIGESQKIILKDLINNLAQSNKTIIDFLKNQIFPTVVIKVDSMTDDLKNESGRQTIEERFIRRSKSGQPWIVPNLMDIEQIKPLTLNDIAINDRSHLDRTTVASVMGVPYFMVGVGEFDKEEYNNFIRTKISVICKAIEQELSRKLLTAPDRYFKFNKKSIMSYDLRELGDLYLSMKEHGVVTGNEVRDVLDLSPLDGLDELTALENYIPVTKLGDQKKLIDTTTETETEE